MSKRTCKPRFLWTGYIIYKVLDILFTKLLETHLQEFRVWCLKVLEVGGFRLGLGILAFWFRDLGLEFKVLGWGWDRVYASFFWLWVSVYRELRSEVI